MKIRLLRHAFSLLILFLSGCATTQSNYLNRDALSRSKIEIIETRIASNFLEFDLNSAFRGEHDIGILSGLMDAVADKSTKVKRGGKYLEIRGLLRNFDIYSELSNQLVEQSSGEYFVSPVKIIQITDQNHIPKMGTPYFTHRYSISQNFRFVTVVLELFFDPIGAEEKSYRRIYSSIQALDSFSSESWEQNAQQWIDNPEILTYKIIEGLNGVITKFVKDFSPT